MAYALVVDDDAVLRTLTRASLRAAGWEVEAVASAAEALQVLQMRVADVVLLDVEMPEMDGRTLLARLRADARTASVPVVFLTAIAGEHEERRLRDLGASGVVTKPFEPRTLASRVSALLSLGPPLAPELTALTAELREGFARELPGRVAELEGAIASARARPDDEAARDAARRVAHKMHGTAGSFGFAAVAGAARQLEAVFAGAAATDDGARIDAALVQLRTPR